MPGTRLPIEVLDARGRKHMGKRERQAREDSQPKPSAAVKKLTAPKWLPEDLREDFNRIARALVDLMPRLIIRPDADTVANYCVVYAAWKSATNLANDALNREDLEDAQAWSLVQDRYFKQARACANDLGLTITSRCRLVVPEKENRGEENPFLKLREQIGA